MGKASSGRGMRIDHPEALTAAGEHYAVASGCPEATAAAAKALADGGNIVDAALTASAVLCVTMPHAVTLGGDLFALVKMGKGSRIIAVNATGAAPQAATIEAYRSQGLRSVPVAGPMSIQTPGLVAGWQILADRWASRPLSDLLRPAIAYAAEGCTIAPRLARSIAEAAPTCCTYPGFIETFSSNGRLLGSGEVIVQRALARTLETVASSGAAGFYEGWVARDIVRTVRAAGGLICESDLAHVRADVAPPLSIKFRNLEISTQPPVSQGVVLLRALRILGARVPSPSTVSLGQYWGEAAKAIQTAFRDRLQRLGDGAEMRDAAAAMIAGSVPPGDAQTGAASHLANTGSDTTTLAIMDSAGNAVSIIQSVFSDLGSGLVAPESGVLLNNRLSGFFLDPNHANALRPGRRTMHTLHSFMVRENGRILWTGGSPGGDMQPQVNLQVLARMIDFGESPEQAVSAARWAVMPGTVPVDLELRPDPSIRIDPELDLQTRRVFTELGFSLEEDPEHDIGSAKIVGRSAVQAGLGAWCDKRRTAAVAAA